MKAYWIMTTNRTVAEVEYTNLADLQKMVCGYISVARTWKSGEVLFVDDEGLYRPNQQFFRVKGTQQPFAGNGVIVGREIHQDGTTADPSFSLMDASAMVEFRSKDQVDAWAKGNASEPAMSFVSFNSDGSKTSKTLQTVGTLFNVAPAAKGKSS